MCRRPKRKSASVCSFSLSLFLFFFFLNALYTWHVRWRVSHAAERVAKWGWQWTVAHRRPQDSHVVFTAHPAKNIYRHIQSSLHFNLTFIKSEARGKKKSHLQYLPTSALSFCLCVKSFLFIYLWWVLF